MRARAPQSQQYFKSTHRAARLGAGAARTQAVASTNLRRDRAQHRSCATEGSRAGEKSRRSPRRRRSKAMARETETGEIEMERAVIVGTSLEVSRVALGTWAIGGWVWGGTQGAGTIATSRAAGGPTRTILE